MQVYLGIEPVLPTCDLEKKTYFPTQTWLNPIDDPGSQPRQNLILLDLNHLQGRLYVVQVYLSSPRLSL